MYNINTYKYIYLTFYINNLCISKFNMTEFRLSNYNIQFLLSNYIECPLLLIILFKKRHIKLILEYITVFLKDSKLIVAAFLQR